MVFLRGNVILTSLVCGACLLPAAAAGAGAVSVPPEAHNVAQEAAAAAQAVIFREQVQAERQRAAADAANAERSALSADQAIMVLAEDVRRGKDEMQAVRLAAQLAAQEAAQAAARFVQIEQSVADGWRRAQRAADAAAEREAALTWQIQDEAVQNARPIVRKNSPEHTYVPVETDELLLQEAELRRMEEALENREYRDFPTDAEPAEEVLSAEQAAVDHAYARARDLQRAAEALDAAAEQAERVAEEKMAEAERAAVRAREAEQVVLDAEYRLVDARAEAADARHEAESARAYFLQLVYEQDNPPSYAYAATGARYYHWSSGAGRGSQLVMPFYGGYSERDLYYAIGVNRIVSRNQTPSQSGRMDTFSDTSLYLSKMRETERYKIKYHFSVNVPTGTASLSAAQRRARMNEDLVETSTFGEGWNFTPGVAVTRKIGQEDSWTAGTSYSWKGSYDPTRDIAADTLRPGGEWQKFLRWQHAGRDWQFVGELIHTTTGVSHVENGDSYAMGAKWETRLTYNRVLAANQSFMLYYWYDHESSMIDLAQEVDASPVHYFGAMWRKKLSAAKTLRLSADAMIANGHRYDSLHDVYVSHRKKYTVGIGCDFKMAKERTLSLDLQRFTMRDGADSAGGAAQSYRGFNILLFYGGSF